MENSKLCPVCEKYEFDSYGEYDLCQVCGWFDDPLQREELNYSRGNNDLSLNEYKKKWKAGEIAPPIFD